MFKKTLWSLAFFSLSSSALAGPQPAPTKAPTTARTKAAEGTKTAQPKLVALPVVKCVECKTTTKKRIAVMPVKVGTLSAELQLPAEVVASKVRDQLEAKLAERPSLVSVSRADLGDVLAEQKLTDGAAFNQELRAPRGKLIPAQLLLTTTVDRVDVSTSTRQESSSTAEGYIKQAVALEGRAREAQDEARRTADDIDGRAESRADRDGSLSEAAGGLGCAIGGILSNCRDMDCFNRQQRAQEQCQERAKQEGERARQRAITSMRQQIQNEVNQKRAEARELTTQASNLRRQAEVEAQKDVRETRTTNGRLVITWKAVDVMTGAVSASGSSEAASSASETGVSKETAFASTRSTASARHDVLVNGIIAEAVDKLAKEVESRLEMVPFRAKVVKVESAGLTLNCGKNLGLQVGDTFGVREKREVLTDPDTGLPLEKPGPPIGIIRVTEAFEKTAFAQVVERAAAPLRRGDELEWIGVYMPQ